MRSGTFHVNMRQMNKWRVYDENVRHFETIHKSGGVFFSLGNADSIRDWLDQFCIFYTFQGVK